MEGTARIWFSPQQKAELWERWKSGQCVAERDKAGEALCLTRPTTIAGAAALVAYAHTDLEIGCDFEWPLLALGNAVTVRYPS